MDRCDEEQPLQPSEKKSAEENETSSPWSLTSIGIILSFGAAGYSNQAYGTPVVYYMYDTLGIRTQQYYVYKALITVPELLVVIYGFVGEMYPILGKRCKYLLAIGLIVNIFSLGSMFLLGTPSYTQILWLTFLAKAGTYCHYSMSFMLAQDRSLKEDDDRKGIFFITGLVFNSLGAILGQLLSVSYSTTFEEIDSSIHLTWGGLDFSQLCLMSAIVPSLVLPLVIFIGEDDAKPSDVTHEAIKLFDHLAEPYVYGPVIGLAGIKFLETSNSAEGSLLLDGCGVDEFQYTILSILGMIMAWAANIVYRDVFFSWGFRRLYVLTISILVMSMLNDELGVYAFGTQTKGCLYYLGFDDLVSYFCSYMQIAVHSVIVLLMCQGSRNGKQNLMITSMITAGWCLEEVCADFYSTWVNVSTDAMSKHKYEGYYLLQLICTGVTCISLFLVFLIPRNRDDFVVFIESCKLRPVSERRSYSMATALLLWWSFAIVFTITFAIFEKWFLDE